MEIFQIVGLGITAIVFYLILKDYNSQFALLVVVAFGALVFMMMIDKITLILDIFAQMSTQANINLIYVATIFKVMGIAYLAEFSAQICRDAGSTAIASKIEFAAKIIIMTFSVPILVAIMDAIIQLVS